MQKHHTVGSVQLDRTTFRLSDDEVVKALAAYVESEGHTVPDGHRFVIWAHASGNTCDKDEACATLVVDHEPAKEQPTG